MNTDTVERLKQVRDGLYWADWLLNHRELKAFMQGQWGDPAVVAGMVSEALTLLDTIIAEQKSVAAPLSPESSLIKGLV